MSHFSKILGIDRTSVYRRSRVQSSKDELAAAELRSAHALHPLYGTRRLKIYLGWGRNKTRRVRDLTGIVIERPRKRRRGYKTSRPEIATPPNILHRYATFKDEDRPQDGMDYSEMVNAEAWAQDFSHIWFDRKWYYLAVVASLKTREIVGWKLGCTHSSQLTLEALLEALSKHQKPALIHSDQGSEYLSYKHRDLCEKMEIQLSCSNKSSPWQNGFMERIFCTIKDELPPLNTVKDLPQLYETIALTIHYYNTQRIHTALGMSPAAYAASLKQNKETKTLDKVLQKVGP